MNNSEPDNDIVVLYFELDKKVRNRLSNCIPWGMRKVVMGKIVEMVCDAAEEHGAAFLGAVLTDTLKFSLPDNVHNLNKNYKGSKKNVKRKKGRAPRTDRKE